MSGNDEREWNYYCPNYEGRESIALRCASNLAGWIVGESSKVKSLGFDILLASSFNPEEEVITAKCARCGILEGPVQKNAIEFFKESIRMKKCISWNGYFMLLG